MASALSAVSAVSALMGRLGGVARWPLWSLPRPLRGYVLGVITVWTAAGGAAAMVGVGPVGPVGAVGPVGWSDPGLNGADGLDRRQLVVLAVLLGCGLATVEVTRRWRQAADRPWRTMVGAWTLPMMLLLPPWWALLIPGVLGMWVQVRTARSLGHRVAFTGAAIGLACGAGSLVFHTLTTEPILGQPGNVGGWVLVGLLAGVVRVVVNLLLVATAVKASDPEARWRGLLLNRDGAAVDLVEVTTGVLVAALCVISPVLVLFAVPALVFLVARHAAAQQLETLATVDHKTGLLTAGAWERQANVEIARARRSGSPLAVAMLDMDDFKRVNDTQGHLGGDVVLRVVALQLRAVLRPTDLVGRFGGDEFAVLLPGVSGATAYEIAERLRGHIAAITIANLADPNGPAIQVTASVGVASLSATAVRAAGSRRLDATDLLAAADHALYDSKRAGRNRTTRVTIGPDN